MCFGRIGRWLVIVLLSVVSWSFVPSTFAAAAQEPDRKVKTRVQPEYPELARSMRISGTVRVIVVIAPSGTVESVRAIGGHPLLVEAATNAVKRWKFEPAANETTTVVEFKFLGGM